MQEIIDLEQGDTEDPGQYTIEDKSYTIEEMHEVIRFAKGICNAFCPVTTECLDALLEQGDEAQHNTMVFGGLTPVEIRRHLADVANFGDELDEPFGQ